MKKPPKISDKEKELFREAMKGVRPIKAPSKVIRQTKKSLSKPTSTHYHEPDIELHDGGPVSHYHGDQALFYAQAGLQHKLIRQLRQGKLTLEARIDLHGQTSEQAKHQLEHFLSEGLQQGLRYVQIIHGKGDRMGSRSAILKNKVYNWLLNNPNILAFCSCQNQDGGTGALYVILKKKSIK